LGLAAANGQAYYGGDSSDGPGSTGSGSFFGIGVGVGPGVGPGVGGGSFHGPRMTVAGYNSTPRATPEPDCGEQCWKDYGATLLKACGEVGVVGGAGSCALGCTPMILGGPGAYGGCFGTCGTYAAGAISACAAAATIRYFQCKGGCSGQ